MAKPSTNKMTLDEKKMFLEKRLYDELKEFKKDIIQSGASKEEIMDRAYEICYKTDMVETIVPLLYYDCCPFTEEEIDRMIDYHPSHSLLDAIYDNQWMDMDISLTNEFIECFRAEIAEG